MRAQVLGLQKVQTFGAPGNSGQNGDGNDAANEDRLATRYVAAEILNARGHAGQKDDGRKLESDADDRPVGSGRRLEQKRASSQWTGKISKDGRKLRAALPLDPTSELLASRLQCESGPRSELYVTKYLTPPQPELT